MFIIFTSGEGLVIFPSSMAAIGPIDGQVLRREVEGLSQNVYHQLQDAGVKARDCHGLPWAAVPAMDSSPVLLAHVLFLLKNDRIRMVNP